MNGRAKEKGNIGVKMVEKKILLGLNSQPPVLYIYVQLLFLHVKPMKRHVTRWN